jgi:hypothetical protein
MNHAEKKSKKRNKLKIILLVLGFLLLTTYVVANWDSIEKGFKEGWAAAEK